MIDDAGKLLLERLEALMLEIRDSQIRMEESADVLGRQRDKDAARKKAKRAEERAEHRLSEPQSHTPNVAPLSAEIPGRVPGNPRTVRSLDLAFASKDLATKNEKKKEIAASAEIRRQTWDAYSKAYAVRYKTEPSRNLKINSQIKQLVERIGAESPEVAAFYVGHPGEFYRVRGHAIGLLLADAEKLRTEWFTQKPITATEARLEERTAANVSGWSRFLSKGAKDVVG